MRVNKFRPVWVKSPEAQRQGALLMARSALHRQLVNLENIVRGILRGEGVVLPLGRARFEREAREAIAADEGLAAIVAPLLAAQCVLRRDVGLWCGPKAWALAIAKTRGIRKARVALARRLAVVLHKMWVTGEPFRWTRQPVRAA